jgi:predicted LPLAT superfamily acyltransferase
VLKKLERLGHWFFYVAMRFFGHAGGRFLLFPVVSFYVVFSRKIHEIVGYYLIQRFPGAGWLQCRYYTLKTVLSFGNVLVDRGWLGVHGDADFEGELLGRERLNELISAGKGVVLLTAHVGNWQSALSRLGDLPVKVHALMQYDQEAAAQHYFDIGSRSRSFEIIDVESPFGGMIEAATALQRGEVVTIMGDRYVKGPHSEVDFLGKKVRLPNSAYTLAATAGAPVVVLLAAKTGAKSYHLKVWDSFHPEYRSRDERDDMLRGCAGRYIKAVEEYLKVYPFQWYNFYNFWGQ